MIKLKNILRTVLVFSLIGATPAQAATVSVEPTNLLVQLDEVFSVSIVGREFTTALDAGGLDLFFDDTVIQVAPATELPDGITARVNFDPVWNITTDPNFSANSINDIFFFADNAPDGEFGIAEIWLKAIGIGSSVISIVESNLNPFAGGGAALPVELIDGQIDVVPIPTAFWLMISGLVGLRVLVKKH